VLRTPDGRIIGATRWGGTYGLGTIFQISGQENFASLHSFSPDECSSPMGELVEIAGDLYGVCSKGGPSGGGAAFRLAANGELTLLHAFGGPPKGAARPLAGLTAGAMPDVLYGTTSEGGKHGVGTVFRMTLDGDVKILHSFCNCDGDGYLPAAPLALGSRGELYGTTTAGGAIDDSGTVFEVATP